jgi:MFS family permease
VRAIDWAGTHLRRNHSLRTNNMASLKCASCGMVNWADAVTCKRCGSNLLQQSSDPSQPAPPVWKWYVAYCVFMAILYLLCIVMGFVFLLAAPASDRRPTSPEEARLFGVVFMVVGLVLTIPFASGPFLPRKPWAWTFGLVLICIGLTSACCLPAAIPLLIFWLKPETKAYFGKIQDH